jgi:pantoate--beta-alanine ligase
MKQTIVAREIADAYQFVTGARRRGRRVGLVPTMGALHAGHLSLVRAARQACDDVVVTVFVNPTQFAPGEDFDRYPRTWDDDLKALTQLGTDLVFAPSVHVMYPPGTTTWVQPPAVAAPLEGEHRPNHFRGVATVVLKLFQILPADMAVFGEKDFQQCLVIRDMVRDLNVPIELRFCATLRDADGLAMSSRNQYLTAQQRVRALGLPQALKHARHLANTGQTDGRVLERAATETLLQAGVDRIDYVALRDPETFESLATLQTAGVLLIAAHVGQTRLIDNCRLSSSHVAASGRR